MRIRPPTATATVKKRNADIGITLFLWSAIGGVFDVALGRESFRRRHVLWSGADVRSLLDFCAPPLSLGDHLDGQIL